MEEKDDGSQIEKERKKRKVGSGGAEFPIRKIEGEMCEIYRA